MIIKNTLLNPQYAWLLWSTLLLVAWGIVYALLKSKEQREKMIVVSLWTSLLGLTEPLFVPEYWSPPSLFDLAMRTGFDLESLLFAFGVGGIIVVAYDWIFKAHHDDMRSMRTMPRHRYHLLALLSAPIVFVVLLLLTEFNPIHISIIALSIGGLATWYCRPDLKQKMLTSALLFLGFYFLYFLTLIYTYPGYVERVWNLPAISGVLVFGIPLEELLFAASIGFFWSSVYEHFTWRTVHRHRHD